MTEQNPNIMWLALCKVPGVGPIRVRRWLKQYSSIQAVWDMMPGSPQQKQMLIDAAQKEYELWQSKDVEILSYGSINYPNSLLEIRDAPLVVFTKGHLGLLDRQSIAVVGSRKANNYGDEATKYLVEQLVAQNWVIVSGLASGIDTIAHQTALSAGGSTIAVLGHSLDQLETGSNPSLAQQIVEAGGLLVSQFPWATTAQKFTFPARNRLMAAISRATLVTQASRRSGSLLTAQAAIDYNKPVFAVPGNIFHLGSQGTNDLISRGGLVAVDAAGIVKTLTGAASQTVTKQPAKLANVSITAAEESIIQSLQIESVSVDQLVRASALTTAEVLAAASQLELKGLIGLNSTGEYHIIQPPMAG